VVIQVGCNVSVFLLLWLLKLMQLTWR